MPVSSSKGLSNPSHVAGNSLNSSFDYVALEGFDPLWSFFPLGVLAIFYRTKVGVGAQSCSRPDPFFTSSIVSLCAHLSFRLTGLAYILHLFVQLSKMFCVIFTKQRRTFCVILLNKWEHFVSFLKHFLNNCNQILHTTSPDSLSRNLTLDPRFI